MVKDLVKQQPRLMMKAQTKKYRRTFPGFYETSVVDALSGYGGNFLSVAAAAAATLVADLSRFWRLR